MLRGPGSHLKHRFLSKMHKGFAWGAVIVLLVVIPNPVRCDVIASLSL